MKKNKMGKRITSVTMAILMVMAMLSSSIIAMADGSSKSKDVSTLLTNITAKITQDGKVIGSNGTATKKDVNVNLSFGVPVLGDGIDESQCVHKGDTATFLLAKGYTLSGDKNVFELSQNSVKVGTLTITSDADKNLIASVVFDGDKDVFGEGTAEDAWAAVICKLDCTLVYDGSGDASDEGDHEVRILDKTFKVNIPVAKTVISGSKSGKRNGGNIDWVVKVNAKKDTDDTDASLSGYVFSDDISGVGKYVADSFKIGTTDNESGASAPIGFTDFAPTDTDLEYTFGDVTGTRYIFFSTEIDSELLLSDKEQNVKNTAVISKDGTTIKSFPGTARFKTTWIEKAAASSDTKNGKLSWTITANQSEVSLSEAAIADVIDSRLNFDSATIQYKTGEDSSGKTIWGNTSDITPQNGVYSLGDINTTVLLTINAHMVNNSSGTDDNYEHTIQTIENKASISWKNQAGIYSGTVRTDIGMNPINKWTGNYDRTNRTMEWNVSVEKSDVNDSLRVLDLLVYGKEGSFDVNKNYTIVDNASSGLTNVTADDIKKLTPSCNQSYVSASFKAGDSSSLKLTVYKVKNDAGDIVADLLVVTGINDQEIDVTNKTQTYTYTTEVTNPNLYAGNNNFTLDNTATLFSGKTKLNNKHASKTVNTKTIYKDVINRTDADKLIKAYDSDKLSIAKSINSGSSDNAFDYTTKEVIYRIHVNADGLVVPVTGLNTAGEYTLKDIKVTDVLPEGWEFSSFSDSVPYLVFAGTSSGNSEKVTANELVGTNLIASDLVTADKSTKDGKNQIVFSFKELKGPYVIYIKARPTDTTVNDFFAKNQEKVFTNTATVSADNLDKLSQDTTDVRITSNLLNKTLSKEEDGVIRWTVEYKPYDMEHSDSNYKIVDKLPVGLDIRTNSYGALVLADDNITIQKLSLLPDGSYDVAETILPVDGENVSYNTKTRELIFTFAENNEGTKQAYRFTYVTDVTADSGVSLSNKVTLSNGSGTDVKANKNYSVSDSDASATMTRLGYIEITKKDNTGAQVNDAEFTIYGTQKQGSDYVINQDVVIRTGTVKNGKLILRGLDVGTYFLKETSTPSDFVLSHTTHIIEITKDNGKIVTTIDGIATKEITAINNKKGVVEIQKVAADTGTSLSGAKLEVRDNSDNIAKDKSGNEVKWTSNGSNHLADLNNGTYKLVETNAPAGYAKAADIEFDVTEGIVSIDGMTAAGNIITMTDEVTKVAISKTDVTGTNKISGAKLQVKAGTRLVDEWDTIAASHEIVKLEAGVTYTLHEVSAPNGYSYAEDITFTVNEDGHAVVGTKVYIDEPIVMKDDVTHVKISKTDISGTKEIKGATLQITDLKGNVIETWTSDITPHEINGKLTAGQQYILIEKSAPSGFAYTSNVTFTVNTNNTVTTVVMKDDVTKVTISKKDITGSKEVSGAKLQIKNASGIVVEEWTSSDTAHIVNGKLNAEETYTLHEDVAPAGYAYSEDVTFTVNKDNTVKAVVMKDAITKVAISKMDITGSKEVTGAKLQIKDSKGIVVEEWTSTDKPHEINNKLIAEATYTLHEEHAPDGYAYAEDITFTVNRDGYAVIGKDTYNEVAGVVKAIVMKDDVTKVTISKTDITGTKEIAGAKLQVKDADSNLIEEWTSTEIQHEINNKLIVGAVYTLHEENAPNGYAHAEDITFTVNKDGYAVVGDKIYGEVNNKIESVVMKDDVTKVSISKTDITGSQEVSGAKLQVKDAGGKVVEEWTSAGKPHEINNKLIAGAAYTLHEENAPDGYAYAEDVKFTVNKDNTVTAVAMKDDVTKVTVRKTDITGIPEIPGAKLQIKSTDGKIIEEWTSTDKPHKINNKLIAGATYTLHEKNAPDGYAYSEDVRFTVSKDGTVDTIVMQDVVTKVTISKTDITGTTEIPGANLQIKNADGKVVEEWISTDKPHEINNKLVAGVKYTLHEEKAPKGYAYAEDIEFTVSKDGTEDVVVMKDDITKVTISLIFKDNEDVVENAKVELIDSKGNKVDEWPLKETNHDFKGELAADETYFLHLVDLPEGYESPEDIMFTVDRYGRLTEVAADNDFIRQKETPVDIKTSDNSSILSWMVIFIASLFTIVIIGIGFFKKNKIV